MKKRTIAIAVATAVVLGAGAYAWAQDQPADPSVPAPAARAHAGARARLGGRAGVLKRVVHADDVIVRTAKGYQTFTYDRGTVKAVSATSITVDRPDTTADPTFAITPATRQRRPVKPGDPVAVLSRDGTAVVIIGNFRGAAGVALDEDQVPAA
jgi:hypothetical protein